MQFWGLFNDSLIVESIYGVGEQDADELRRVWKEAMVAKMRQIPVFAWTSHGKPFSQDSWCPWHN
jgi:hypothetical protein